ncbi:hypothetical protein [Arenimonas oryziterrae]|uniref:Uncharacterized protein n=1 Tax=Arenimonas oryziterrae DSM 21050 = YC6267 TaxID=1121015 RepID=A0A091BD53_9GAMM|nr:hypothetical protein [Arenimonas oryziterrae]KFN42335.1 hypothetical protein N789_14190 [Arenimonas oryziterrae DSM 21050 = YC6267]
MLDLALGLAQFCACLVIFVTGVFTLNDLPRHMGKRWFVRKVALVMLTAGAGIQAFRPTDVYVCLLLAGVALFLAMQRDAPWFKWAWHGHCGVRPPGAPARRVTDTAR